MVKKLLNTMKYGNAETKRKIYLMLGAFVLGLVLLAAALVVQNLVLGIGAALLLFIDGMIFLDTSFELKTVSVNHNRRSRTERRKKGKEKKQKSSDGEEEDTPGALEWISSEKEKKEENGKEEKAEEESKNENPLAQYDEKKLKKLMVAYKVKRHHVPILIDLCSAERIVQSPAYLWNDAVYLYFLVLEEEPRLIKTKRSDSDTIHIRKGMTARPMEEYPELNEPSVVNMIFGGLMPKYYKVETGPYRTEYRKNLYSAAPGIWCTSASVKNLLKLLPNKFVVDGGKIEEESIYYQEIYIARLMFWDSIYSAQEYKEKVLDILGDLIRAEIAERTVLEYLNAMMANGLIPREYAEYVISKRKK